MPGADRVVEDIVISMAERADDQFEPFGVHWYSKPHGIFLVLLTEGACRNHHQLIGAHGISGVGFSATYHDTIFGLVHDAHVVVGMLLLMGMQRAIPFDIRLRYGHGKVVIATMLVVAHDALVIVSAILGIDALANDVQGEQTVAADLLDD